MSNVFNGHLFVLYYLQIFQLDPVLRCGKSLEQDDNLMGLDIKNLNIKLTHSERFHQFRPGIAN